MKITFLLYSLNSGGAERVASILINYLSKKYEVELVLMNDSIFYDLPQNVKIKYIEKSSPTENGIKKLLKIPFLAYKYKKIIKNSDVSISFMNRPNYINVLAKMFGSKTKTIISERIAPLKEYSTNSLKDVISRFLIKSLYKKADAVVPNSKYIEYELKTYFGVKRTKVIYNPVENVDCNKEKSSDFVFINVGRLEKQKNHELLMEAFKESGLDARLWIIGDGYLKEKLLKKSDERIIFKGKQKDVYSFLKKADCFVLSSDYEGFPNVIIEALNCSLPVISTDCKSGPREILAPGTDILKECEDVEICEYGILTKPGSKESLRKAMRIIFEDSKLRYNFSKRAKERIKSFDIKTIISEWENLINEK